jgi:hypothetical protein
MENLAKPSLGCFRPTVMKKFVFAILTIAALSGAALVTHSSPSVAQECHPSRFYYCE